MVGGYLTDCKLRVGRREEGGTLLTRRVLKSSSLLKEEEGSVRVVSNIDAGY